MLDIISFVKFFFNSDFPGLIFHNFLISNHANEEPIQYNDALWPRPLKRTFIANSEKS